MRIMGVDTSLLQKDKGVVLSISIVEHTKYDNELIYVNSMKVNSTDDKLINMILNLFKDFGCDYLAMDKNGVNICLYSKLVEKMDESRLKCNSFSAMDTHELIDMLRKDNILSKIGMKLEFWVVSGRLRFPGDCTYTDLQYATVYSIGVANKVLNEEKYKHQILSQKGKKIKEDLLDNCQQVIDTLLDIRNKLIDM